MSDAIDVTVVLSDKSRSCEFRFPDAGPMWPQYLETFTKHALLCLAQPVAVEVRSFGGIQQIDSTCVGWYDDLVAAVNRTGELPRMHK
jgi:hypothetical protein